MVRNAKVGQRVRVTNNQIIGHEVRLDGKITSRWPHACAYGYITSITSTGTGKRLIVRVKADHPEAVGDTAVQLSDMKRVR